MSQPNPTAGPSIIAMNWLRRIDDRANHPVVPSHRLIDVHKRFGIGHRRFQISA